MINLNPTLTAAGLAIFSGRSPGFNVAITHVAFGSKKYDPIGYETTLHAELARFPIDGAALISPSTIQVGVLMTNAAPNGASANGQWIGEIGFYTGDTLFAVLSHAAAYLFFKSPDIDIPVTYVLDFSALPPGSISVNNDALSSSIALASSYAQTAAKTASDTLMAIKASYYGPLAYAPSTRPDGTSRQAGDRYFDTEKLAEKTWNGSIWYVPNVDAAAIAKPGGSGLSGFIAPGTGAVATTVEEKLRQFPTLQDRGTVSDGATDDTAHVISAITNLGQRGHLTATPISANKNFKLTSTIEVFGKAGSVIDFGNQQFNFSSMTTPQIGFHFKNNSESVISNLYVIGNLQNTKIGALFGAADGEITIHSNVGKVRVASCDIGIQIGVPKHQYDDTVIEDIYGSGCRIGVKIVGENTLAMYYGKVAAYQNSQIGVHIESGGGFIASLLPAGNPNNLFFGRTDGQLHGELSRWDIASGYSEMGTAGEVWINSASCTDDNPFTEEIIIGGYRSTPFTVTNVSDFVQWRLNGDLRIRGNINHGQQEPVIMLDHNIAYRAPSVFLDGVIDCRPYTDDLGNVTRQVPMSYRLTHPSQAVEINARVNNGVSFWNNEGAANEGVIKSGIYMAKLKMFEASMLDVPGLIGAWCLREVSSGIALNTVLGGASLIASSTLERRDVWFDDGLIGFFRGPTATSKTLSTNSAVFSAAAEYTFSAILRPRTEGTSEENMTNIGGVQGMRIALYNEALLCLVGNTNAFVRPTNPYDAHLVIGRYISGASIRVDAINLRTGEKLSAITAVNVPEFWALTWVSGVNIRNDHTLRGAISIYNRAISDGEALRLMQSATLLTSTWRK